MEMGKQKVEKTAIIANLKLTNLFRFVSFLIGLILNLAFSSPRTDYRVSL